MYFHKIVYFNMFYWSYDIIFILKVLQKFCTFWRKFFFTWKHVGVKYMSLEVVATALYSFSIIIWKWWYQKPGLKKSVLITYWQWFKLFAMVTWYFHGNFFVVSKNSGPRVFCSNNKLWCNCWMSLCFEMLGLSALQWYWQKNGV